MTSTPYVTTPITNSPDSRPPYDEHGRLTSPHPVRFPPTPPFTGFNTPLRAPHLSLPYLPISGQIPAGLNGTFYRVQPDRFFPPLYANDIHFNGDGAVTAISLLGPGAPVAPIAPEPGTGASGGDADQAQAGTGTATLLHRYVQTTRFVTEQLHGRALFGSYRNQLTDDPLVQKQKMDRTVSNTNVVFWRGALLAMKEDGLPVALDPETLETQKRGWDFEGQVRSPTFTAHPKIVPKVTKAKGARGDAGAGEGGGAERNGIRNEGQEMVCFAYEAGGEPGDCSVDCVVWTIDEETGKKLGERWFKAPFAGMIHDCGVSENWVVLPLTPLKMDLERMKRGGEKFAWDPEEDQWYGVVPRDGNDENGEVVWFRADNGFHGHVAGCYELPSGEIIIDLTVADNNVFYWFPLDPKITPSAPPLDPKVPLRPNKLTSPTMRWIIDPHAARSPFVTPQGDTILVADTRLTPAVVWPTNGEFSRIDERYITKPYRHFWQAVVDPSRPYDFEKCGPPAGGLFNCLGHFTWSDAHFHSSSPLGSDPDPSTSTSTAAPVPPSVPTGRSGNGVRTGPAAPSAPPTHTPAPPSTSSSPSSSPSSPYGPYGTSDIYHASPTTTFQEPTFIPSPNSKKEGEGYIIALLNHLDQLRNDVVIFDALNLAQGPVAVIHLPMKLKLGLHGNWVDRKEVEGWKAQGRLALGAGAKGKEGGEEGAGV
ncbi:carotenoid oxygenase, partial [Neurospora tetraspora]